MGRFRKLYGDSPLHLLAVTASLAIATYGFFMIFQSPSPISTMTYFIVAIFAHDLISFPLYSGLNLIANKSLRTGTGTWKKPGRISPLNYFRVPFMLSALAFIVYFPLILNLSSERYFNSTGLTTSAYMGRWLGICAVLFTGSAMLYAIRLRRAAGEVRSGTAEG